MNSMNRLFAVVAFASFAFAVIPSQAGDDDYPNIFVKMCDASPDGKVSKAQVMKAVEKMFDKHDTKKEGKLDRKQAEFFSREFMRQSGG